MKNFWHVNHKANISGTSFQLKIKCKYESLLDLFSDATWQSPWAEIESGTEKVAAEWVFENQDGHVVTLYDWKGSSLIDEWHVGAHDSTTAHLFELWLSQQVKKENEKRKVRLA